MPDSYQPNRESMTISIALCTYNGTAFLKEQLASFAHQTLLPDELVVCDDGSTDDTLSILEHFAATAPFPVHLNRNAQNMGVRANFFQAIARCKGDLIALADQDDVWLPEKLCRARSALDQCERPSTSLYFSRLRYVDERLNPLGMSPLPGKVGFFNAIVENVATGCSVVFGTGVRRLLLQARPEDTQMHDWWAYLVASAFGEIVYDPVPSVLYRQHRGNVAGWEPRLVKTWNRCCSLLRRLSRNATGMDSLNQAAVFATTYPDLPKKHKEIIEELIQLRAEALGPRLRYILRPRVGRNDWLENVGLKILLLMRWH